MTRFSSLLIATGEPAFTIPSDIVARSSFPCWSAIHAQESDAAIISQIGFDDGFVCLVG